MLLSYEHSHRAADIQYSSERVTRLTPVLLSYHRIINHTPVSSNETGQLARVPSAADSTVDCRARKSDVPRVTRAARLISDLSDHRLRRQS